MNAANKLFFGEVEEIPAFDPVVNEVISLFDRWNISLEQIWETLTCIAEFYEAGQLPFRKEQWAQIDERRN
jgi:hypothetical protein